MSEDVEWEICRLCGYVRKAGGESVCPACGAKHTVFVPFKVKASPMRLKWLKLDIHPVTVHFTVGYTATTTILFLISLVIPEFLGIDFKMVLDFFVLLLPLFVIAGGVTGAIDGKVRYRKIRTPYLKLKLVMAISFIPVSALLLIVHFGNPTRVDSTLLLLELILIMISMAIASILGWYGAKLVCPIVPRGTEIKK
ncbi:MAG: hypothetical protein ACXAEU_16455 [Candidatus Hodarchaeales archaeon]|jgi:hypothetical protein